MKRVSKDNVEQCWWKMDIGGVTRFTASYTLSYWHIEDGCTSVYFCLKIFISNFLRQVTRLQEIFKGLCLAKL